MRSTFDAYHGMRVKISPQGFRYFQRGLRRNWAFARHLTTATRGTVTGFGQDDKWINVRIDGQVKARGWHPSYWNKA